VTGLRLMVALVLAPAAIAWAEEPSFVGGHNQPGQSKRSDGKGADCIKARSIKAESAESETSLIFHANDGSAYRNRLPKPCDGLATLNNLATLSLGGKDGSLCAGDLVWVRPAGFAAGLVGGGDSDAPGCVLGSFSRISEMSLSEFLRR
jgi:hypothetical protein